MSIFGYAIRPSSLRLNRVVRVVLTLLVLIFGVSPQILLANQDQSASNSSQVASDPSYTQQTSKQLQQLVAPIALYPDSLVAQILAASTFPEQVVEADRWMQAHSDMKGDALANAVNQQPWDPSVKALTAFPSILGNMDKNLSWTSSLGDTYYNQQQDVMNAVQVMRQRAQQAGNLKTTKQQTVSTQGSTIIVKPVYPDVVYVPAYDPWLMYGSPILGWPGWYPYPGIWFGGSSISFGVGFGVGWFGGYGWGWGHWGCNWNHNYVTYNNNQYNSRSNTFYNRNNYYHNNNPYNNNAYHNNPYHNAQHGGAVNHSNVAAKPFNGNSRAARGYTTSHKQSGVHSDAFSGYNHGGVERSYSSRGSHSYGNRGFNSGDRRRR